jgi:hypothetical protein
MFENKKIKDLKKEFYKELDYVNNRFVKIEKVIKDISEISSWHNKAHCPICGNSLITVYPKCKEKYPDPFSVSKQLIYYGIYGYCETCKKEVKLCKREEE